MCDLHMVDFIMRSSFSLPIYSKNKMIESQFFYFFILPHIEVNVNNEAWLILLKITIIFK